MTSYYKCADFLLLSLKDSPVFSLTIPGKTQSYLSAGKPVIASIAGEAAAVINEAQCGLTCSPSDVLELEKTVREMNKKNWIELETMGKNAKYYFDNNFSKEILLEKLEKIFEEL